MASPAMLESGLMFLDTSVCALNAPRYAMFVILYLNVRHWTLSGWNTPAYFLSQIHTMLSFMWQNDMHAVIRFIDVALRMSVLREAELPPNQPDVVG